MKKIPMNIKQILPYILQIIHYLFKFHAFLTKCDACTTPEELWTVYQKNRKNNKEPIKSY